MDKQAAPILAKSALSGSSPAGVQREHANDHCIYGENCPLYAENPPFNAVTLATMQEARDIMSGKKKTKSYNSAEEFLADLKA